jgi:hypothetical protein
MTTGLVLAMGLFFGFGGNRCQPKPCKAKEVKVSVEVVESDQAACEEEVRRMISLRRLHVFRTPAGCFEGCGISRLREVPTCRPNRKMRLTGDCTVEKNGWFYRARLWR